MRLLRLIFIISFSFNLSNAQINLDVQGDAKISGKLNLNSSGNSIYLGEDTGQMIDGDNRQNVFIGFKAGSSSLNSGHSVFIGSHAGALHNGGYKYYNVFIGSQSGYRSNGEENIAIGRDAGYNSGSKNIFIGHSAGKWNTIGDQNLIIGYEAGLNSTGENNIGNTFIGYQSGQNNSQIENTFIGYKSGYSNSTGASNTFIGYQTGLNNSWGHSNSMFGAGTGQFNTTGYFNTFIGRSAGHRNSTGHSNTFLGMNTGLSNTSGNENTFIGKSAGENNEFGNNNTFIGYQSGNSNQTGSYNSSLGDGSNNIGTDYNNSTGLGFDADPDGSNVVRIGNANITSIKAKFDITVDSDARFKTQITKDHVPGLDFIKKLTPVTYYYDSKKYADWKYAKYGEIDSAIWDSKYDSDKILTTGFIAQEVEAAAKSIGYEFSGVDKPTSDKATYGLRYSTFVVPLVKAVQEQQDIIEEQQKKILLLEKEVSRNDEQDRKIEELENLIAQLLETKNSEQKGGGNQDVYLSRQPTIDQNIPNPFNGTTVINYYVPEDFEKDCTIIITNIEGKEIQRIGIDRKGNGSITLDANQLISGSYNYSLMLDGRIYTTKRMILQK